MKTPSIEAVLREHGAMLIRMAAGYANQYFPKDELAQEMAVAVWKALPAFRGDGDLRAFVARTGQFAALGCLRSRKTPHAVQIETVDVEGSAISPDHFTGSSQQRKRLLQAIQQLPVGQRECVLLLLEGFENSQIATILGVPVNTLDQRLSRARRRLRTLLEVRDEK